MPRISLVPGLVLLALIAPTQLIAGGAASLLDLSLEDLSQVEIKTDITSIRAKPIEEQPGIVSVVTADQIHQTGARDLSDVLMLVPGFALDTDVESMIGLTFRGLQGQEGKVLLIVDGMELNEPLYGSLPILDHIPAEAIKQVETLQAKAVKYDALFKKQLEERCKKLPPSVTMLLDKLDPEEQMTWLDENADKLFFPAPESGPQTPKPTNPAPNAVAVKERKSQNSAYTAM